MAFGDIFVFLYKLMLFIQFRVTRIGLTPTKDHSLTSQLHPDAPEALLRGRTSLWKLPSTMTSKLHTEDAPEALPEAGPVRGDLNLPHRRTRSPLTRQDESTESLNRQMMFTTPSVKKTWISSIIIGNNMRLRHLPHPVT